MGKTMKPSLSALRKGDGLVCHNGRVFDFDKIDESALEDGELMIWAKPNTHGPWHLDGRHRTIGGMDIVRVVRAKVKNGRSIYDIPKKERARLISAAKKRLKKQGVRFCTVDELLLGLSIQDKP